MKKKELEKISEISLHYTPKYSMDNNPKIGISNQIYELMKQAYNVNSISHHEQFWIVLLNTANKVLGISKIGEGCINSVTVDVRIIFQYALKANAVGIILVHNHPSNELTPSSDDKDFTRRVTESGRLLNIKVLDHIIITSSNGYFSFCDKGMI